MKLLGSATHAPNSPLSNHEKLVMLRTQQSVHEDVINFQCKPIVIQYIYMDIVVPINLNALVYYVNLMILHVNLKIAC